MLELIHELPLVIYGKGKLGKLAQEILLSLNIRYESVIDKDSLNCISRHHRPWVYVLVAVTTESFTVISNELRNYGFINVVPVWDILELYADKTGIHNGWEVNDLTEIEIARVNEVRENLEDGYSKQQYIDFIKWRMVKVDYEAPIYRSDEPHYSLPSTLADIKYRKDNAYIHVDPFNNFVYIHQEGKELSTLHLLRDIFRDFKNMTFEVACYHNSDGLYQIPLAMMQMLPNHIYSFRLMAYQGQAAYFRAVPRK